MLLLGEGIGIGRREDKEEEESEGNSDSSLELGTLPHLIVYHGLLSSDSKLLPGAQSRVNTPMDERPGSILNVVSNVASTMTKSGVIKDERDTPNQRVRHRDGKLLILGLRRGMGGVIEDEDAPPLLTLRFSTLNLFRRSSASSIMTSGSLNLSASASSITTTSTMTRRKTTHSRSRMSVPSDSAGRLQASLADCRYRQGHGAAAPAR
ncbi:hypothetical protein BDZ97DRAFT_1404303 [Flammula alnicola]|nr:hypothetical protein BDZ97DRAFT_598433 [Flammula alnicola]KAF8970788.1 hypothetical protein BDZ97DRAFT_1404303 [Flammula alnicola]